MKKSKILLISLLCSFLLCNQCTKNSSESDFSIDNSAFKKHYFNQDVLNLSVKNVENKSIDSIIYYINDIKINTANNKNGKNPFAFPLKNQGLGYQNIKALVFSEGEPKAVEIVSKIEIVSNITPKILKYNIVNTYPHDTATFTEGLEFYKGILYESTGLRKKSKVMQTDAKTGKILKQKALTPEYFGEGLTIINDKLYHITWQENTGFIMDPNTLEIKKTFAYNKKIEGWGMTNDGTYIYQSDGTEKIWKMNPENQQLLSYINIYSGKEKIQRVNELEWINGKIYANIWQKDAVAVINPENGAVEAVIDFSALLKTLKNENAEALNGIAYKKETNTIFITGKNWDKMFEIKVLQ